MTGNWTSDPLISETSLEDFVTTLPPGEEKDQFLRFIWRIFTWDQDARISSNNAIKDDWLIRPIAESDMADFWA